MFALEGYRIRRELARGGMGAVYDATDPRGEQVAIKVMLGEGLADPELVGRFQLEARALEALDHPGILRARDHGVSQGQPFLVLDFLEGPTLAEEVRARGPLPTDEALRIGQRMANALAHAHARGVVHRDLKPENVILRGPDDPVLVDFGLVRMPWSERKRLTSSGTILGSPCYMSPEQAMGSLEIGPAADLYGLGATLYFLLTGAPPHEGGGVIQILERVIREQPTPPRMRRPEVDPGLEAVVLRCLRKEPSERFPAAVDVEDALDALRARGRPWVPALALVALALAALALGLGWRLRASPAEPHVERARVLVKEGQLAPALEALDAALAEDPDHPAALLGRGLARNEAGDREGALEDFGRLLELDPEHLVARNTRALIYADLGQLDRAQADLEYGLERHPDDPLLYATRSVWHRRQGRLDEGLADARRAAQLAPRQPKVQLALCDALRDVGDLAGAYAVIERVLEQVPSPGFFRVRGELALELGRLDRAAQDLTYAVEHAPRDPAGWIALGKLRVESQDAEGALEAGERVRALRPQDAGGYILTGDAHLLAGRHREAEEAYSLALERDPGDLAVHLNRATSRLGLRQHQGALADLEQVLAVDPRHVRAISYRADVFANQGRLEDAVAEYRRAIELRPERAEPYVGLAEVLFARGLPAEAFEAIGKGIELDPRRATAYFKRARMWLDRGAPHLGLEDATRAFALDPEETEVRETYGRALLAMDRPLEALEHLDQALQQSPNFGAARLLRAEALSSVGRTQEAFQELDRAPFSTVTMSDAATAERARAELRVGRNAEAAARMSALEAKYGRRTPPKYVALYGQVAFTCGDLEGALEAFERALALHPYDRIALLFRGLTLAQLERFPEALAALDACLEWLPDQGIARAYRGMCYHRLRRNAEALADLDLCLERRPNYVLARIFRGLVREATGDVAGALEDLERARAAPEASVVHAELWKRALEAKARCERELAGEPR